MLVEQHGGLANLCEELGFSRKETSGLSRILNANLRHDRDGEPYVMGSAVARNIEERLKLSVGWMDTPPNYFEVHRDLNIAEVVRVMEAMQDPRQREKVMRIVATLAEPETGPTNPTAAAAPVEAVREKPITPETDIEKRLLELDKKRKPPPRPKPNRGRHAT